MRHLFAVSILFLALLQLGEARTHQSDYRVESFLKRIRNEASDMLLEIKDAKEKEYVSKKFHRRIPQEKLNVLEEDMDSNEDENIVRCDTTHYCDDGNICCYSGGVPYACCPVGTTCSGAYCVRAKTYQRFLK